MEENGRGEEQNRKLACVTVYNVISVRLAAGASPSACFPAGKKIEEQENRRSGFLVP